MFLKTLLEIYYLSNKLRPCSKGPDHQNIPCDVAPLYWLIYLDLRRHQKWSLLDGCITADVLAGNWFPRLENHSFFLLNSLLQYICVSNRMLHSIVCSHIAPFPKVPERSWLLAHEALCTPDWKRPVETNPCVLAGRSLSIHLAWSVFRLWPSLPSASSKEIWISISHALSPREVMWSQCRKIWPQPCCWLYFHW